jgi:putative flippase GtrA
MQFFLYLIVGGLSFLVEIVTFIALRRAATPVIAASVASFIVATIANYLLSIVLAFQRGRFRPKVELARFLMVVLVGLMLNTALVWIFVYRFGNARFPPRSVSFRSCWCGTIWAAACSCSATAYRSRSAPGSYRRAGTSLRCLSSGGVQIGLVGASRQSTRDRQGGCGDLAERRLCGAAWE